MNLEAKVNDLRSRMDDFRSRGGTIRKRYRLLEKDMFHRFFSCKSTKEWEKDVVEIINSYESQMMGLVSNVKEVSHNLKRGIEGVHFAIGDMVDYICKPNIGDYTAFSFISTLGHLLKGDFRGDLFGYALDGLTERVNKGTASKNVIRFLDKSVLSNNGGYHIRNLYNGLLTNLTTEESVPYLLLALESNVIKEYDSVDVKEGPEYTKKENREVLVGYDGSPYGMYEDREIEVTYRDNEITTTHHSYHPFAEIAQKQLRFILNDDWDPETVAKAKKALGLGISRSSSPGGTEIETYEISPERDLR